MVAKGLTESSKNRVAEASESFVPLDNARALDTMGENQIVPIKFNKTLHRDAEVVGTHSEWTRQESHKDNGDHL